MEILEMKEIEAALEGILFASGEPVHIDRICLALDLDRPTAELVLQKLGDYYSFERRGIRLVRMADTWQLCSAPEYAEYIAKPLRYASGPSFPSRRWRCWPSCLLPAHYRAYIDQIRGVDSSYTVGLLLDRHMIESVVHYRCRDGPGCTALPRNSSGHSI